MAACIFESDESDRMRPSSRGPVHLGLGDFLEHLPEHLHARAKGAVPGRLAELPDHVCHARRLHRQHLRFPGSVAASAAGCWAPRSRSTHKEKEEEKEKKEKEEKKKKYYYSYGFP